MSHHIDLAACEWCRDLVPADELSDGRECSANHCRACPCAPCALDRKRDVR